MEKCQGIGADFFTLSLSCHQPGEDTLHPLVEQVGKGRDQNALEEVHRHDGQQDEARDARDRGVDLLSHGQNGVHRDSVELGEFRQEIDGVEQAAENRHDRRAGCEADQRGFPGFVHMIENGRGDDHGAADGEVCKVAHKGRAGALEEQLDDDLQKLRYDARDRPEIERADQHRHLAEVQLVERRREKKRDLQCHQHARKGRRYGDEREIARLAGPVQLAARQMLAEP